MIKSKRIWITVTVGLILIAVITVIVWAVGLGGDSSFSDTTAESETQQNETTSAIPSRR